MLLSNGNKLERLGTSGSRVGPVSEAQEASTIRLLESMWPFKELHHGVCIGWDEWLHFLVRELFGRHTFRSGQRDTGPQIHGWPPLDESRMSRRAYADLDVVHEAKEHKARDREIAWHSQGLIAGPKEWGEIMRSGTWYTTRQMAALARDIWIVRLDGTVITDWRSEMNERVKGAEAEELAQHPFDFEDTGPIVRHHDGNKFTFAGRGTYGRYVTVEPSDLDEAFGGPQEGDDLDDVFG